MSIQRHPVQQQTEAEDGVNHNNETDPLTKEDRDSLTASVKRYNNMMAWEMETAVWGEDFCALQEKIKLKKTEVEEDIKQMQEQTETVNNHGSTSSHTDVGDLDDNAHFQAGGPNPTAESKDDLIPNEEGIQNVTSAVRIARQRRHLYSPDASPSQLPCPYPHKKRGPRCLFPDHSKADSTDLNKTSPENYPCSMSEVAIVNQPSPKRAEQTLPTERTVQGGREVSNNERKESLSHTCYSDSVSNHDVDTNLSKMEYRLLEDAAEKKVKAVFKFCQSKAVNKVVFASEKRTKRLNSMRLTETRLYTQGNISSIN
jgi:hypothetical protein